MSDPSHDVPGQTSDFEFRLVKKDDSCTTIFPVDGIYQGWFMLKQAPPAKGSVRIDDKEMEIHFSPAEEDSFKITGRGSNKFGLFKLNGTLSGLGAVHIYREYYQLTPQSVPTPTSKKAPPAVRPEGFQRRPSVGVDPNDAATPREGAGRVRKQSSAMREYQEFSQKPSVTPRSSSSSALNAFDNPSVSSSVPVAPVSSSSGKQVATTGERSHRLPAAIRKCSDLLREMSKLPQARWFLEPVDPIKLGIPDYPKIIKSPMDFSTIRSKVDANEYDTIEAFAEDMRLVFRNAITFNSAKDNIVNINAREVSSKFEDRYRMIIAQLEGNSFASLPPEPKMSRSTSAASFSSARGGVSAPAATKLKRMSSGSVVAAARTSLPPGPRQIAAFVPPAAVDSNASKIIELERQLAEAREEISQLKALLHEREIAESLKESREAAQTPLSYEEKRQLVGMVAKLPAEKMDELVAIIREGMPDDKKNDEISEVPLEILDTLTLRRLQKFLKENIPAAKKRPSTAPRAKSEPSTKKARKSAAGSDGAFNNNAAATESDIGLFDEQELLMEKDHFVVNDESSHEAPAPETVSSANPVAENHYDNSGQAAMMMGVTYQESVSVADAVVGFSESVAVEVSAGGAESNAGFMLHDDDEDNWEALG